MRKVFAIAKREILSFFVSPVAYFVLAGFIVLGGYFFFNLLALFMVYMNRYRQYQMSAGAGDIPNLNQYVVEGLFQTMVVVLVFLVPLLTMRIIAEDKKKGTFELLVTSPLSIGQIVWGKFLGIATILILMMLTLATFPFLLVIYGEPGPEILPIFSGLLAIILCSLSFASIGMAVSCFTENQVVAGISSMVTLLLLYVIQAPAESLGGTAAEVLNYISPTLQLKDMVRGVITLESLVYFFSVIFLGLFLSKRALEAYRWR